MVSRWICGLQQNRVSRNIPKQLIFYKSEKAVHWRKESFPFTGTSKYPYVKQKNFSPYVAAYIKINSKWVIDLNVKPKDRTFLEKKR